MSDFWSRRIIQQECCNSAVLVHGAAEFVNLAGFKRNWFSAYRTRRNQNERFHRDLLKRLAFSFVRGIVNLLFVGELAGASRDSDSLSWENCSGTSFFTTVSGTCSKCVWEFAIAIPKS
jgi:hypothetical protein